MEKMETLQTGDFIDFAGYAVADKKAREKINEIVEEVNANKLDYRRLNFFRNKRVLIVGDSISDNTTFPPNWTEFFINEVEKYGCTVNNASQNGRFLATVNGNNGLCADLATIEGDYDYIILFAGTNDCTGQNTIGTLNDTTADTVMGALYTAQTTIKEKWNSAIVYMVTPLRTSMNPNTWNKDIPLNAYRSALYTHSQRYSWCIIDGMSAPMLDPITLVSKNLYISDGLHPVPAYAPILKEFIIEKMLSYGDDSVSMIGNTVTYTEFLVDGLSGSITVTYYPNATIKLKGSLTCDNLKGNIVILSPNECLHSNHPIPLYTSTGENSVCYLYKNAFYLDVPEGAELLFINHTIEMGNLIYDDTNSL